MAAFGNRATECSEFKNQTEGDWCKDSGSFKIRSKRILPQTTFLLRAQVASGEAV